MPVAGMLLVSRMVMRCVVVAGMIMTGMIMIVMATACRVIMIVFVLLIRRFFARGLLLRQQGRLEAELAQRILDLFHRGFVFGKRKVQPLAGH